MFTAAGLEHQATIRANALYTGLKLSLCITELMVPFAAVQTAAVKIIYACLASPKDAVICIEQPEAFLYPAAQSELAKFLYHTAAGGHQVFIETNSDNVFNALRTGIVKKEIRAEDASVNYLVLDGQTHTTKCNPVRIVRYGNLQGMNEDMTLDGFFDQYSKDLDVMLGL